MGVGGTVGAAGSTAATAQGDFGFFGGRVPLAIGFDQGQNVGALAHFQAGLHIGVGTCRQDETRGQRGGVFFHQQVDLGGVGQLAGGAHGHHGTVFGDVGRDHRDLVAVGGGGPHRFHGIGQCFGGKSLAGGGHGLLGGEQPQRDQGGQG